MPLLEWVCCRGGCCSLGQSGDEVASKYTTEDALEMLENSLESESGHEMNVDNCFPTAECGCDTSDNSYVEQADNGSDYDISSTSALQYSDTEDRNSPDGHQTPVNEESESEKDNSDNPVNDHSGEGSKDTLNSSSCPSTVPKTRKRVRKPETWVKTKRSKLRNSGKAYNTKSGKQVTTVYCTTTTIVLYYQLFVQIPSVA